MYDLAHPFSPRMPLPGPCWLSPSPRCLHLIWKLALCPSMLLLPFLTCLLILLGTENKG